MVEPDRTSSTGVGTVSLVSQAPCRGMGGRGRAPWVKGKLSSVEVTQPAVSCSWTKRQRVLPGDVQSQEEVGVRCGRCRPFLNFPQQYDVSTRAKCRELASGASDVRPWGPGGLAAGWGRDTIQQDSADSPPPPCSSASTHRHAVSASTVGELLPSHTAQRRETCGRS